MRLRALVAEYESGGEMGGLLAEEKRRLQAALDNTKGALKRVKDDVAQKAKLLASLRAARTNDERVLVESRTKQAAAEEKLKRARGEISRRKAQIEALMAAQGLPPGAAPPGAAPLSSRAGQGGRAGSAPLGAQPAPTAAYGGGPGQGGLAAADSEKENLREKLRASSMDRARAKQQAHVLRTKLEDQALRIRDLEEKLEASKVSG